VSPEEQVAAARELAERGRVEDALAAYDAVVALHGDDPDPDVADAVADALGEKARLLDEEERAEETLAAIAAILEHDAARVPEPDEADAEVVAWRAADRRLRVMGAHARRGWVLSSAGGEEAALAAYEAALALDDGSGEDDDVLTYAGIAWTGRAHCLNELERFAEAVAAADAGLARLAASDSDPAEHEVRVARLMYNKAWALRLLGRRDDELDALAGIEARFGAASVEPGVDPDLRTQVVHALDMRASTLVDLARDEEAVAVCDALIVRFADAADAGTRAEVAKACRRRAHALEVLARFDEAIAAYRDTLLRFGADEDPEVRPSVLAAMAGLAGRLTERGDADEALVMFDAYMNAGGDAGWALTHKGTLLHQLGRHEEALASYDELLALLDAQGDDLVVRARQLVTLMNRVEALGTLDRIGEASETEARLVALAGDDTTALFGLLGAELGERDDPQARIMRAGLVFKEAVVHRALGRGDAARELLEGLVARSGDDALPDVRRIVAHAREELGDE
jgi:tetratricopeptide (TPR) repeat protein